MLAHLLNTNNQMPRRILADVADEQWSNWQWQQQHACRDVDVLHHWFPGLTIAQVEAIRANSMHVRFQLTPYMASLVRCDSSGAPDSQDPVWNAYVPLYSMPSPTVPLRVALGDNWELPDDMVNPILQHKYENRVNFRIQNRCLAYCSYCFEAKRVLDRESAVGGYSDALFDESLQYIRRNPEIEEVVVSGGEPLTLSNDRLGEILRRIRSISQIKALRIQTRAFTQNPFRIDQRLLEILAECDVTAIGVHAMHPCEITYAFESAIERIHASGHVPLLLGQTPLLKGINDSAEILHELFMRMYSLKVKPYYLIHAMPETLGADNFRTSVRIGVRLYRALKRRISNPAMPEYIIVHARGKHTVPWELEGSREFTYCDDGIIRFKNWRGQSCEYEDSVPSNEH